MAATLNSFVAETQLTKSEVTLVSTTAKEKKFLGMVTVTNTSISNVEVTLWRLPSATTGTTVSGGNWSVKETIPANKTVRIDKLIGQVLDFSMKLSALSNTASAINVDISGSTET